MTQQLYQRIAADLRRRIVSGEFAVGSRLPGRALLTKEYHIALPTLERAMGQLIAAGEVTAERRKGTVVTALPGTTIATPIAKGCQRLGLIAPAAPDDLDLHLLSDQRLAQVIVGMERSMADVGGELLFRNLYNLRRTHAHANHTAATMQAATELLAAGADALCLVDLYAMDDLAEAIKTLAVDCAVPLAYCSTRSVRVAAGQICIDLDHSGNEVITHLCDRGYRKVCYLAAWPAPWVIARERSCAAAAPDSIRFSSVHHGKATVHLVHEQGPAADTAISMALSIHPDLFTAKQPWAIICPNDIVALQVLAALKAAGRQPGRDCGVIALDDSPSAFLSGLSVMTPPLIEAGTAAVAISAVGSGVRHLKPRLIARPSTRLSD